VIAEASASGGPISCENEIVPPALRTRNPLDDGVRAAHAVVRDRPLGRSEGKEDEAAGPQAQLHAPVRVHVGRDEAAHKALYLAPVEGA
jgi:hypothetical protein